jgi:predicted DNA-binding protein (MmcQ/YjbR family)
MIPSLTQEPGIFPAYHMSKTHWVTVVTDGAEASASEEMVEFLTEVSFTLTAKRTKK